MKWPPECSHLPPRSTKPPKAHVPHLSRPASSFENRPWVGAADAVGVGVEVAVEGGRPRRLAKSSPPDSALTTSDRDAPPPSRPLDAVMFVRVPVTGVAGDVATTVAGVLLVEVVAVVVEAGVAVAVSWLAVERIGGKTTLTVVAAAAGAELAAAVVVLR